MKESVAEELCQLAGSNNNTVLPTTSSITNVRATKSGTVVKVEAATVAKLAQALGAGRSHPKVNSPALLRSERHSRTDYAIKASPQGRMRNKIQIAIKYHFLHAEHTKCLRCLISDLWTGWTPP